MHPYIIEMLQLFKVFLFKPQTSSAARTRAEKTCFAIKYALQPTFPSSDVLAAPSTVTMKVTPAHVFLQSNDSLQVVLTEDWKASLSLSLCHRAHLTSPWHLLHNYEGCQKGFGKYKKHLWGRGLEERCSMWRKRTDERERGSWEPIKYPSVEVMSYEIRQPGNTEVSLPFLASFAKVWKSHFFTTVGFSFSITVPTDLGRLLRFSFSFFLFFFLVTSGFM